MGRRSRELRERRLAREGFMSLESASVALAMERGCLFCRRSDGGFTSREHILAESLGNRDVFLPKGVVCDRCNNGPLAHLDDVFCNYLPVAMRRTLLGIPAKSGRIPEIRFQEGTVRFVPGVGGADPTLEIRSHSPRRMVMKVTGELTMKGRGGKPMTKGHASELSRALLKMGLEFAWLDHGEETLKPKFDHIRAAVLGESRSGYFATANKVDSSRTGLRASYFLVDLEDGECRMALGVEYAGVVMLTDSRLPKLTADIPEGLLSIRDF
jgi:hypothetical protein